MFYIEEKSIKQKKKLIDKLLKMRQDNEDNPMFSKGGAKGKAVPFGEVQTNTKLLVEGLTKNTPTQILQNLFESYPGFKDVNHIIPKNVAFIEFETDDLAGAAMMALNNYTFKEPNGEQVTLRISYMKR
jgi:RNA recognition motif. (a.k.a. RRM, RBD, or RNP domain)